MIHTTFIRDRDALQSNDKVEWSSLGKVYNPVSSNPDDFLPHSFVAKSLNDLELTVNIPTIEGDVTPPFVLQNGLGVHSNFAFNNFLLFTGFSPTIIPTGNPNPLTIVFDRTIKGAGTQIAASGSQDIDYEVFISAFDEANNLLGTFSLPST